MKAFDFHRPASLAAAAALLAAEPAARPLAGGMTLIPSLKLRLAETPALLDLSGIAELRGIRDEGDAIVVGAMTRHADVAASALLQQRLPALAALAGGIGDPQVRHRGTLGGAIANNDPAADYPAALLGLDAVVVTSRREIPAAAFFTGLFETALQPGELVAAVRFPLPRAAAYEKVRSPASRYALVGSFVARLADGSVRVAVSGAGPCVFRCTPLEVALEERFGTDSLASARLPADGLNADLHADAAYRAHLVVVTTRRAVARIAAAGAAA